jgi:hypothetical protein
MDDSESCLHKYRLSNANKEYSVPIPFMDGDMTALEIKEYCKKIYNFITATYYPLVDENYYPKPTGMQ